MATPDIAQQLIQRVKASPFPMRAVCERAQVAASTPSRWKTSKPNVGTVEKLDTALNQLLREKAKEPQHAG